MPHKLDQWTLIGLTHHNRRTGIAALQQRLTRIEPQAPAQFTRSVMALGTVRREKGPDFFLKKLQLAGREFLFFGPPDSRREQSGEQQSMANILHGESLL